MRDREKDLISIIIPMYNMADYIKDFCDCIQNQTYEKFEALIVNDGSTDSSPKTVETYAAEDSRFKLIN